MPSESTCKAFAYPSEPHPSPHQERSPARIRGRLSRREAGTRGHRCATSATPPTVAPSDTLQPNRKRPCIDRMEVMARKKRLHKDHQTHHKASCTDYPHPLNDAVSAAKAARYHSEWIADTGTFSHGSPGDPYGDDFVERIAWARYSGWSRVGENIAARYPHPLRLSRGGWSLMDTAPIS